jgi:hypothetical protein
MISAFATSTCQNLHTAAEHSDQADQEVTMSEVSQGPGWWQASDGKWYAPEQHPAAQAPTPPPAGSPPPAAPGAGTSLPAFSFDLGNLSQSERITGVATLVLFISLFLPWFTYSFGFGSVSVDGLWHGWMYLVLIICLGILAYLVMRTGYRQMPFKPGGIGFSGIGWGFGAFLGLAAAIVAAVPLAVPAIKARRS